MTCKDVMKVQWIKMSDYFSKSYNLSWMNEDQLSRKLRQLSLLKIRQRTNRETFNILAFLYCYRAH